MRLLKELEKDNRDKILGLLLAALSLLLFISLITYDFNDDHARIKSAFSEGGYGSLFSGLNNRGGVVGALIAFLMFNIFGYFAFFIPAGLVVWGWNRFLGKPIIAIKKWSLISVAFAALLMTLVSLPGGMENLVDPAASPGGIIGHFIARMTLTLFGSVFSWALTISLILTGLILVIPSAFGRLATASLTFIKGNFQNLAGLLRSRLANKTTITDQPKHSGDKKESFLSGIIRIKKKKHDRAEIPIDESPDLDIQAAGNRDDSGTADDSRDEIPGPVRKRVSVPQGKKGFYQLPPVELLNDPPDDIPAPDKTDYRKTADALRHTLLTFGVEIDSGEVNIYPGPVITRFEFKPASGIKVSQITNLADDLALAMQAERIRIVAPIPGKSAVGVEIPNRAKSGIFIKDILSSGQFKTPDSNLLLALGKTTSGEPFMADLAAMPHLLIAGSTGSGKSVCLNCLIISLIFGLHPDLLRFILIDPKRLELSVYDGLPHLERPVVTDMRDAEKLLGDAVLEMEERYRKLARAGVRNIADYNKREKEVLPYLVIVVDELADMMMSGLSRVESLITRLAQMARAVGIHLVLATQRPSVDVITGLIKANFSTRIAFQTATKVDSRTILDANGAEKLLGKGDMLFSRPGLAEPIRIHGAYISSEEIERTVEFIAQQEYRTKPVETFDKSSASSIPGFDPSNDPLYKEAVELVIRHKQGSVSLLQRRLGIGYQRAARLIDQLEHTGIVGPYDGSKAREVLVTETFLESDESKK